VAPDTMQQNETESAQETGPKPPEYWTEANTAAWTAGQWDKDLDRSSAQMAWDRPIRECPASPKSRATLCAVIPAETMAQWRLADPRPSATHYYDGTPITHYQPLRVKKPRARKGVAA
jgi:hypothetical protein